MEIDRYLVAQRARINQAIAEEFTTMRDGSTHRRAAEYCVLPEGHRYRSMLGLELHSALGGTPERFLRSTVAIEFLHHTSLLFDDLPCMDNAPVRKGKPATHVQYGEAIALLAGLYLHQEGMRIIAEELSTHPSGSGTVVMRTTVHGNLAAMVRGQELDLRERSDEELWRCLSEKNALFRMACALPAYLMHGDQAGELPAQLSAFGEDLAIAYQLFDDLRDVEGNPAAIGKPIGIDKEKGTSVYRFGVAAVKMEIIRRKERITESLARIPRSEKLEKLVEHILTAP